MGIIIWLIVGGVVGWLASMIMKTDAQQGILLNVVVGIVGALLSKFDTKQVGYGSGYAYGGYDYQSRDERDTPRLAAKVAKG